MRHFQAYAHAVCAIVLSLACAACSSGGAVPPGHSPSTGTPPAKKKIKATIRITIPTHRRHRKIRARGHYVSPATQSIAIAVTPSSGPVQNFNANLTPATNQNCTASLISPLVCTVTLTLAPGSYTATFATYDGVLSGTGGPADAPTGSELSGNQAVPLEIVAGASNSINVVLDGIPAGVTVVPGATSSLSGNTASGFTANKCGGTTLTSDTLSVIALDADENFILGPGAPTPSLTLPGSPPAGFALATPKPNSPNVFTLTHAISSSLQGPATLTATVTPLAGNGGSPVSAPVSISVAGGTAICGVMTEFHIPDIPHNFVRNPESIAVGPDGNLWFTELGADGTDSSGRIGKSTTAGTITEYTNPACPPAINPGEADIAAGYDGNLWFTNSGCGTVETISTSGTVSTLAGFQVLFGGELGIAKGPLPDGSMWFTLTDFPGVVKASGAIPIYNNGLASNSRPRYLVAGPDGNEWFTETDADLIGQVTTDGTIANFGGLTAAAAPWGITLGPDGALWFAERFANKIGRMTTGGAVTEYPLPPYFESGRDPEGIALGPDGALWFTENLSGSIGRMTTDGTVTEYSVPTSDATPVGIVAGPDGAMWFTEQNSNNKIGRLQ